MKKRSAKMFTAAICFAVCLLSACGKDNPKPVQSSEQPETKESTSAAASSSVAIKPLDSFVLEADKTYIGEDDEVLFSVQLDKKTALQAPLELLRDGEKIGELADDGRNGDKRTGDGIYSLRVEKPVQDRKTSLFCAGYGEQRSESLAVNLFRVLTEEEVQKEQEALNPLSEALQSVSAQEEWTAEKRSEIESMLHGLQEAGTVRLYEIDETGFYVKLNSGIGCVYNPASEDTMASGADTQMQIAVYESSDFKMDYPFATAKEIDDLFPNYSMGKTYKGITCNRNAVNNLHANQIVLWSGHGTYYKNIGPVLELGEPFVWAAYWSCDVNFIFDIVHDLIMNDIGNVDKLLISSKYIDKYCGDLSGSFICLCSCYGMKTNELSDAFLNKGAVAVYGYTDVVKIKYCSPMASTVFQKLMTVNQSTHDYHTLEEAVDAAIKEHGPSDKAAGGIGAAPMIGGGYNAENYRLSRAKAGYVYGAVTNKNGNLVTDAEITFKKISEAGKKVDYPFSLKPSDSTGSFEAWLPSAEYEIRVTAEGYEPYSKEISIEYGKLQPLNVQLEKEKVKGKIVKGQGMEVLCPDGWIVIGMKDNKIVLQKGKKEDPNGPYLILVNFTNVMALDYEGITGWIDGKEVTDPLSLLDDQGRWWIGKQWRKNQNWDLHTSEGGGWVIGIAGSRGVYAIDDREVVAILSSIAVTGPGSVRPNSILAPLPISSVK